MRSFAELHSSQLLGVDMGENNRFVRDKIDATANFSAFDRSLVA